MPLTSPGPLRDHLVSEFERPGTGFSLDSVLIESILRHARPLGHREDVGTLNLGFGFLYYALVRALRPKHVVVIGSGFGFSVVCLALALRDNGRGHSRFVDPSYSVITDGPFRTIGGTAQWDDPQKVEPPLRAFRRRGRRHPLPAAQRRILRTL